MIARQLAIGAGALALLLTGCASGSDSGTTGSGNAGAALSMPAGHSMAGMTMAPGQSMAGMAMAPTGSEPSAASKMVCAGDVRDQVRTIVKLGAPAPVSTSWQDRLFTCTYTLPMGKMVLSVKESPDRAAAAAYFQALRTRSGATTTLRGVGEQAFATRTGVAVVLKDSATLRVDTTGLPEVFGAQRQRRTDLAYEMATVVMGCWTEHAG